MLINPVYGPPTGPHMCNELLRMKNVLYVSALANELEDCRLLSIFSGQSRALFRHLCS